MPNNSSNTQRIQLQPAYVLHHRPYRDTSRIVELFTRDCGRLTVFARGVRGGKAGWAASLQAFQPLLVSWSGRGEAGQLTAAELVGEPQNLPSARLMSGFYLNELLLKLLHVHDPHADIFELYDSTVQALKSQADELSALRIFEKRLLHALGYGLLLDREAESGEPIQAERCYRFVLEHGLIQVSAAVNAAQGVYSGAALLALLNEDLHDAQQRNEARYLLRAVLDRVLEGRRLQSREISAELRHLQSNQPISNQSISNKPRLVKPANE
jgi:DNA repair protein RecO (recombination protein O)